LTRGSKLFETKVNFECPASGDEKQVLYQHSEKHRDGNPGKSQWTISRKEEALSFEKACGANWTNGNCGWGIHIVADEIAYLGRDRDAGDVFLAKYDNHALGQWHGYPCDYRIDNQRPTGDILQSWVEEGFLKLAKMRKIVRGQRCAI
jgi:hypothetical protein